MYEVQHVLSVQNRVGESPIWSVSEQALYWCDIAGNKLFRYVPTTSELQTFALNCQIGCVALVDDRTLLLATDRGFAVYDFENLSVLQDNAAYLPPARFNDGKVDRQGRFWAGTASGQPNNYLYRLDPDGVVSIMEGGIRISNGIAWSPDNTIMYYADSGEPGVVYAYDFDLSAGGISNRRIFLPPTGAKAVVDGITVDSEGCIWCAYWDGWRVARYSPDGMLLASIEMPVQRPTSCTFGGSDLTELYVTSASQGVNEHQQPLSGDLFRIHTGARGLPEPTFNSGTKLDFAQSSGIT